MICQFLGVQSTWVLKVPNCLMGDPLYAVKRVEDGLSPVGFPSLSNLSGNSLENVRRGMTLPPAPVSTLHFRVASLFPMSAGNSILAKASIPVIFTSSMVMVSSSHKAWLRGTTPAPTTFRADAVPVPTSFRDCSNFHLITVGISIGSNIMDLVLPGLGFAILLGLALSSGCLSSLGCPTLVLPVSNFSTCTTLGSFGRAGGVSWGVLHSTVAA